MSTTLLILFQLSTWTVAPMDATVGDTVYLSRRLAATPDVHVRLSPLEPSQAIEPLTPPRWSFTEGALTVVYAVALFEPGSHVVELPSIELVYADGRTEMIAGESAVVDIASVLPPADTALAPMPSRGPIARARRDPIPLALLAIAALSAIGAWGVLRRRRGPRPTIGPEPDASTAPVEVWVAAGESRAVAAMTAERLREQLARQLPELGRHLHTEECIDLLQRRDLGDTGHRIVAVLRALERARFSPAAPGDVLEVVDEAERVLAALRTGDAVRS